MPDQPILDEFLRALVEDIRTRHKRTPIGNGSHTCSTCLKWPCDAALLLSVVDQSGLTSRRGVAELSEPEIVSRFDRWWAQLGYDFCHGLTLHDTARAAWMAAHQPPVSIGAVSDAG